jgi:tryptophan aminotransferase
VIDGQDLDQALQYGPTPGLAKLRNLLLDTQEQLHKRPKGDWTVNVGSGTQDLMYKVS